MCVQQWAISEGETKGLIQAWAGREPQGQGLGKAGCGPRAGRQADVVGGGDIEWRHGHEGMAHRGTEGVTLLRKNVGSEVDMNTAPDVEHQRGRGKGRDEESLG